MTLDEGRYIPAGVYHWRTGEFALANDSPPLARMVAALPLLPLDVHLESYDPEAQGADGESDPRDRELAYGGRFASADRNFRWYKLFCLSRMMGLPWWLLGAWVIWRWSVDLYGRVAGLLAMALWCSVPNLLAWEQLATPEFPAAVIGFSATYAFRGYLLRPSWQRALAVGLWLGVAQLVAFASLILFVVWPLMALFHRLTRGAEACPGAEPRTRLLQAAAAIAVGVWIINLGYGLDGTGWPLGQLDFASPALNGDSRPPAAPAAGRGVGNRFRGTWLGRAIIPLPADYLEGLDRRLHERETSPDRPGGEDRPVAVTDRSLIAAGGRIPIGVWGMMVGGLVSMVRRRCDAVVPTDELLPWIPVVVIPGLTTSALGPLSPAVGILLTIPCGIVIASGLARWFRPRPGMSGFAAAALSLCTVGGSLITIWAHQFTPERVVLFRRDLDHLREKFGFPDPERRGAADIHPGERGLLYRTFVDSRGAPVHYALFVPPGYRGDRAYPLILFLHGYGDRGTTGRRFTSVGLPVTVEYRDVDSLVLFPQGQSGTWEPTGDDARRTMELLAAVQRDYRVDPKRIYLTGLSSGGTGVWGLAAAYPDRWAAIVPVAGAGEASLAPAIKHIPCWCFHNRYDGAIPVERPRRMIEALRAAGARPRYTEFLDINHSAWEWAYDMPALYDWLLQQRLP